MKTELYQRVAALSAHQRVALAQRLHQLETRKAAAVRSQHLVGYVVSAANAPALDPSAIRTALKAKLPPYMVPAVVMPIPSLPRTANGKIDTRALPEPPFNPPLPTQSTAPRTPVEESLAQIWSDVLGVTPIGIHDDFFELGGDSILSIQIVSQAREAGFRLAPNQLFEQPTIAELAAVVNQTQPVAPWSSLVPMQTRGSRLPFFFHGGSADALTWARFSRLLGEDQPFYAMQRPDLESGAITYTSVEDLATACIDEMRTVQPNGPYLVGGHCFGGTVAFEIVQQLQAQGVAIASLIEIDAYCPNALPNTPIDRLYQQLQRSYFLLRKSYYYYGGRKLAQLPRKIWQRIQHSKSVQLAIQPASLTPLPTPDGTPMLSANQPTLATQRAQSASLPYEERYTLAHQANVSAAERYCPQAYPGHIKLFRADVQNLDWRYGPHLGWQTLTPKNVEIINIPGFFGNLFNQQSGPLLARQVRAYLDTLQ